MTDAQIAALGEEHGWNINAMARAAGRFGSGAFERHARRLKGGKARTDAPVIVAPPSPDIPVEDLVEERKRRFEIRRKYEDARALIPVKLKTSQPIGLLFFGWGQVQRGAVGLVIGLLGRKTLGEHLLEHEGPTLKG